MFEINNIESFLKAHRHLYVNLLVDEIASIRTKHPKLENWIVDKFLPAYRENESYFITLDYDKTVGFAMCTPNTADELVVDAVYIAENYICRGTICDILEKVEDLAEHLLLSRVKVCLSNKDTHLYNQVLSENNYVLLHEKEKHVLQSPIDVSYVLKMNLSQLPLPERRGL